MNPEVIALFERALAAAQKADYADAPFPLNEQQAALYHRTRADLLQWVLEMLDVPAPIARDPA